MDYRAFHALACRMRHRTTYDVCYNCAPVDRPGLSGVDCRSACSRFEWTTVKAVGTFNVDERSTTNFYAMLDAFFQSQHTSNQLMYMRVAERGWDNRNYVVKVAFTFKGLTVADFVNDRNQVDALKDGVLRLMAESDEAINMNFNVNADVKIGPITIENVNNLDDGVAEQFNHFSSTGYETRHRQRRLSVTADELEVTVEILAYTKATAGLAVNTFESARSHLQPFSAAIRTQCETATAKVD